MERVEDELGTWRGVQDLCRVRDPRELANMTDRFKGRRHAEVSGDSYYPAEGFCGVVEAALLAQYREHEIAAADLSISRDLLLESGFECRVPAMMPLIKRSVWTEADHRQAKATR